MRSESGASLSFVETLALKTTTFIGAQYSAWLMGSFQDASRTIGSPSSLSFDDVELYSRGLPPVKCFTASK